MLGAINNVIIVIIAGVLFAHQCLLIKECLLFERREVISKSAVLRPAVSLSYRFHRKTIVLDNCTCVGQLH